MFLNYKKTSPILDLKISKSIVSFTPIRATQRSSNFSHFPEHLLQISFFMNFKQLKVSSLNVVEYAVVMIVTLIIFMTGQLNILNQ